MATGQILSTSNTSFAIATAQKLSMVFIVGTSTKMPPHLAPNSQMTVYYRAIGERQWMAEQIIFKTPSSPPAPDETPPTADRRALGQTRWRVPRRLTDRPGRLASRMSCAVRLPSPRAALAILAVARRRCVLAVGPHLAAAGRADVERRFRRRRRGGRGATISPPT
jgi:hypothetical protein